ncbi:MAG: hypothetical protein K5697_12155 [Lachnospiraceae bacterium]|nr:hypothetical protein [Lachnospiraceae bacterium]
MKKRSKKTGILIIAAAAVIVVAVAILVVVMSGSAGRSLREQLTLGDRYLSEMDYEKALAAYRAAIEIDPGAKEAYEGFTLAYLGWAEAEGVGTPQAAARLEQAQTELEAFRSEDNTEIIEVQLSRILERMALLKAAKEKGEDDPANDPVNDGNADKGGGDGVGETPTEPTEDPTEAPAEPTEVPIEPTETPTPEVPDEPEPSEIDKYIKDGVFDVELFANDTGASEWHSGDNSFIMIYNGTVFVQSDTEATLPGISGIIIGIWDTSRTDYWNVCTHSFLLDTGDTINTSIGVAMSKTALGFLPETVGFVKANGVDTVPDVEGTNFKPCDPNDETIQY